MTVCARVRPSRGLRWGVCGLAAAIALVAIGTDPADARRRKRVTYASYNPPYAALVVDANTGEALHATNADSTRHPASLTKIMTLYLLFEQLEAGKLRLDSRLPVSEHAASQAPTKLGLRPGQTLEVEDAIKGLVTKSANDAAVVVAEAIGGSEEQFASMMTRKARALGMSRTVYANASGLPDDDQITTARDQATLGRAIQERFPRYYRYFSTRVFSYHGRALRNHNRLLGNVEGVDGIKTGYIRKSGFNLVSSVRRGNRHIVAVVLGGRSAGARDARMRGLIEEYITEASSRRTAPLIAEAAERTERKIADARPQPDTAVTATVPVPTPAPVARAAMAAAIPASPVATPAARIAAAPLAPPAAAAHPAEGSAEPIRPYRVKTITVKASPAQVAAFAPLVSPAPQATVAPTSLAQAPAQAAPLQPAHPAPQQQASALPPPPPGARPGVLGVLPAQITNPDPAPASEGATYQVASSYAPAPAPVMRAAPSRRSWIVQIGAFPEEGEARERLRAAQNLAKGLLSKADPFTEKVVVKGRQELYRARFAVLDEETAEAACKVFKRNEIACFTTKN
jgi:D-alanyl-D-alanine carboxypeptidase